MQVMWAALALALGGCAGSPALRQDAVMEEAYRSEAIAGLNGEETQELAAHLARFGTRPEAARLASGLVVYRFAVDEARGTAIVAHGYLDDSTAMTGVIKTCLDAGWEVLAVDLPGHGLSGGARADIGDFAEYGEAMAEAAGLARPGPVALVAHSAGAAAALEYARRPGARAAGLFLMAPLVRVRAWGALSPLLGVADLFTERLPVEANRGRYLNPKYLPFGWTRAYRRWYRGLGAYPALDLPAVAVYGGNEDVLDAKAGSRFLREKLPGIEVVVIEGGGHFDIAQGSASPALREALAEFLEGLAREGEPAPDPGH